MFFTDYIIDYLNGFSINTSDLKEVKEKVLIICVKYINTTLIFFTIGKLVMPWYRLYKKSRMIGDYHVRFCERNEVKFLVPT